MQLQMKFDSTTRRRVDPPRPRRPHFVH